jgi:hypothetical protein
MKKHLFAMASAVLLAPAASALEGDTLGPIATTTTLSGQAVASDAVVSDGAVSFTEDGGKHGGKHGGKCCDPCHRCFWIYGEYINWWTRGDETPTLLRTTSTRSGVSATQTFGNDLNDDYRQGFRAGGGFYPHCRKKNVGVEANWFSLGDHNDDTIFPGGPSTIVERPFTNVITGQPDALIVAGGPRISGQASINHSSRFWGGNVGLRHRLGGNDCGDGCGGGYDGCIEGDCGNSCQTCFEFQYGYQYYQLNETLNISTSTAVGTTLSRFAAEDFDNSNQYHGGYLGLVGEYNCGKWFVGGNVRAGVGYMQEVSRIRGSTSTTIGGVTTTAPIGTLLVQPSNAGGRVEDEITWSGEVGVKIGFQPTCWFRTYVGYDFIYIDQTFRPGGAVNDNVNFAQLDGFGGGVLQPSYSPRRESFWAHGFNAGMELKF